MVADPIPVLRIIRILGESVGSSSGGVLLMRRNRLLNKRQHNITKRINITAPMRVPI